MSLFNDTSWQILYVEDDDEDVFLVRKMLGLAQDRQIELSHAATFEEGRSRLENDSYDAVLVDYDLGAHTGLELIRAISPDYPAPLILYTGRGSHAVDMEALSAGVCEVGILNTYYYGRYVQDKPGEKLKIFWPNQQAGGVHVNVSGAGVTRYARHPESAQRLLEWLASPKAQGIFASLNLEYPASPAVAPDPVVAAWGTFQSDPMSVVEEGKLQAKAVMLMDRAGYR